MYNFILISQNQKNAKEREPLLIKDAPYSDTHSNTDYANNATTNSLKHNHANK